MKSLTTLIKLAQRNIDAIAIEIARTQSHIDELMTAKAMAKAREETERKNTSVDIQMMAMLPAYMLRARGEQQKLDAEIAEAEQMLEEVRTRLNAAYREKSKLENLETSYVMRASKEEKLKEQAMLDEAALTRRA